MAGKNEKATVLVLKANAISVSASGGPNTLLPEEERAKATRELGEFLDKNPRAWMDFLNQLADALVYAHGEVPKSFQLMDKRDMADKEAVMGLYSLMTGLVDIRRNHVFDGMGNLSHAGRKATSAGGLLFNYRTEQEIKGL